MLPIPEPKPEPDPTRSWKTLPVSPSIWELTVNFFRLGCEWKEGALRAANLAIAPSALQRSRGPRKKSRGPHKVVVAPFLCLVCTTWSFQVEISNFQYRPMSSKTDEGSQNLIFQTYSYCFDPFLTNEGSIKSAQYYLLKKQTSPDTNFCQYEYQTTPLKDMILTSPPLHNLDHIVTSLKPSILCARISQSI